MHDEPLGVRADSDELFSSFANLQPHDLLPSELCAGAAILSKTAASKGFRTKLAYPEAVFKGSECLIPSKGPLRGQNVCMFELGPFKDLNVSCSAWKGLECLMFVLGLLTGQNVRCQIAPLRSQNV